MSINNLPQHASTDTRNFSDRYLLPKNYDHDSAVEEDIEYYQRSHDFIIITDEELIETRQASKYTLNYGDALAMLLEKRLKEYLQAGWINSEVDNARAEVYTSFYSEKQGKLFYFIQIKSGEEV